MATGGQRRSSRPAKATMFTPDSSSASRRSTCSCTLSGRNSVLSVSPSSRSADNPDGSGGALGEPAAAVLPQHRPCGADDVAVRGGGAAAPGGRTSMERLQKCEHPFRCAVAVVQPTPSNEMRRRPLRVKPGKRLAGRCTVSAQHDDDV